METVSRDVKAQNPDWPHLARGHGNVGATCDELVKLNRGRPTQCVSDQQSEFFNRTLSIYQVMVKQRHNAPWAYLGQGLC